MKGCQLHPGHQHGRCRHCTRAAAATETALSNVIAIPAGQRGPRRKTTPQDVARVRELGASGMSIRAIARELGMGSETVSTILSGRSHAPDMLGRRVAHQLAMGTKAAKREARETHMPVRDGVG
jgi:hypothetical protein